MKKLRFIPVFLILSVLFTAMLWAMFSICTGNGHVPSWQSATKEVFFALSIGSWVVALLISAKWEK